MNHGQEARITRDNGLSTFLGENTLIYASDAAFQTIASKTIADYALTIKAAAAASTDNTGYYIEKIIARQAASVLASQLCASSQVKLDLLGNIIISSSLNSTVSFYTHTSDTQSASRLQNVHDVMLKNLASITTDYLTEPELATLQTKINKYRGLSGTTTSINSTSPVTTKELAGAIKTGSANVVTINKLSKKYLILNPTFYNSLQNACKIPTITILHTPVFIKITDSKTGATLAKVNGTLSKTKELGVSTAEGIITYTNVSGGVAIATFSIDGYITGVQIVKIKRGKTNTFAFTLIAGIMTTEMKEAIDTKVKAFTLSQEAKKNAKTAKAKARKAAVKGYNKN